MKTAIVIPTYNEAENIKDLIAEIFNLNLPDLAVIVVDDNSPDGTGRIVEALKRKYPALKLVSQTKKMGLGRAYQHGFSFAFSQGAEAVMEMDADFSHDPQMIPEFLTRLSQGYQAVIGSRRIPGGRIIGWNIFRHLFSWGATATAHLCLQLKTKDITTGYRAFSKKILDQINYQTLKSDGYAFQVEMVYRLEINQIPIKEIPICFKDREKGQSKLAFKEAKEFFKTLWRLKFKS